MSDGGPGFVEVLHRGIGGELVDVEVSDPLGRPVRAQILVAGGVAYLESAQASILTDIATKKALDDDIKKRLTDAIKEYKGNFLADRAQKNKEQKETVAAK